MHDLQSMPGVYIILNNINVITKQCTWVSSSHTGMHTQLLTCGHGTPAVTPQPPSISAQSCRSSLLWLVALWADSRWTTHCLDGQTYRSRNESVAHNRQRATFTIQHGHAYDLFNSASRRLSQCFNISHLIKVPHFHCPVKWAAKQFVRPSLKGQPLYSPYATVYC